MRWLAIAVLCAACKQASSPPPPPAEADRPWISTSELKRGQDACKAYIDRVCACPSMAEGCKQARPLADALQIAADVGTSPDSARRDSQQALASVRNIIKKCIEQTAKLAANGCVDR